MISTGRALEPDDDRSSEERMDEASRYLKNQGALSIISLIGLTIFAVFPNIYAGLACVVVLYSLARYLDARTQRQERISARSKTVLITGCDTGFGHALAKQLSSRDVTVFAGCLRAEREGPKVLKKSNPERIHILQMDVTRNDEIEAAVQYVNKVTENKGLWGLVNNAALTLLGDVELTTMEQFEKLADVNQLGVVRVTKAFLPLIRKQKGRIVNVSSISGRLSSIYRAAYGMTKFAVETFSDILRQEMRNFGVQVVIIEPGNFGGATDFLNMKRIKDDVREMWRRLPNEARTTYGKDYVEHHVTAAADLTSAASKDISLVINAMEAALFTIKPDSRYLIGGSNSWYDRYKLRVRLAPFLPEWYLDGLEIHQVRCFPTPDALIGQEDH